MLATARPLVVIGRHIRVYNMLNTSVPSPWGQCSPLVEGLEPPIRPTHLTLWANHVTPGSDLARTQLVRQPPIIERRIEKHNARL